MCLAVPGKVIKIDSGLKALVDFGGVQRNIQLDLMPTVKIGEYVLVHAGFAIQKLSARDAKETMRLLNEAYNPDNNNER